MKTIFIDLNILPETSKDLLGFVLSQGYNFRKIEQVIGEKAFPVLVVEAGNKSEEKALNAFLKQAKVSINLMVENDNKAGLKGKKLGVLLETKEILPSYYRDKSTGKKFYVQST
jgi:hypothetical protein